MIDFGENEIKDLEEKQKSAFQVIKDKNYEHYI